MSEEQTRVGREVARMRAHADFLALHHDAITEFEAQLVAAGTTVIKVMLHVSPQEQQARFLARLDDPTKQWKFNPNDVDERGFWNQYQEAYQLAIQKTTTVTATAARITPVLSTAKVIA